MAKQLNVNLAFTADAGKVKTELKSLQQSLQELTNMALKSTNLGLANDVQSAIKDVNELQIKLQSATNSLTGGLDLGSFSASLSKGNKSLQDYADSLCALGPQGKEAFAQLAQAIVTAEVPLKKTSSLLSEFATTLKNTARWQISSSVLHGFMGALSGAYGYAKDLNESLNEIRIVTGESEEQMAKFAEQANKAAQSLSSTTTAYTNAALIFYQQGLDDDAVKERTDTVIKMSNVTGDSAEDVSSYMTAIWENFADGSKNLEYYADVITRLGADTAASSAEIAEGIESFASIGETIGLSYEYATSALTTIVAKTRASASEVGNGLRTIFSRLQNLSLGETLDDGTDLTKYSKALETVGVSIKDASGELKSMDSILDDLAGKWDTLDQAEKVALANTVGGVRQYTKLISLMDNWDFMKQNIASATNSEGSLQEQADIYAESWEAAQKRVKAAWQAIYSDLIDDKFFITILNTIEKLLQGIDNLIDAFGGLSSIVPFIGTILLKTFGNDLSNSIDRVFTNIYQGSEIGKQKILDLRKTTIKTLAEMQNDGTAVGAAQAAVYAGSTINKDSDEMGGRAGLQNALLEKTQELQQANKTLTEEEEKQVQLLLDQNEVLGNEYINITKNLEAQKESAEQEANKLLTQYKAKEMPTGKNKDVEGFQKQLGKIKQLQKEYTALSGFVNRYKKTLETASKGGEKDFNKLKSSMIAYAKAIQTTNPEIQDLQTSISKLTQASDISSLKKSFEELELKISDVGVKAYQAGDKLRELGNGAGIANIDDKVDSLLDNFGQVGALTDQQVQTFANFDLQVNNAKGTIENLDGSIVSLSQGFTAGAQAGMSYAMALSTAQNFGEQLFDQDVSVLQKTISLFMLLTTAVSAVNEVSKAGAIISAALTNAKQQETLVTAKQVAVEKIRAVISKLIPGLKTAEVGATTAATAATEAETAAVNANTIAWFSNPILAIIAVALLAVVAVINAVSSAMKKNSEKIAENAEKSREAASASKEVTDANQEQIDSYNEAYQAYLKDKTAKDDLIEVSKNVCDQLDIENAALLRAKGDYEGLTKAIYNYQDAQIATALQKNQRAQNDTGSEFVDNMRKGDGRFSGDKYIANIGTMWQNIDDETIVQDAIASLGDQLSHITDNIEWDGTVKVETGQSTEELKEAYEEILSVVEETERLAGNNTDLLNNSENYQAMLDWLDKSKDSYEALIALEDEEAQLRTQQIVNSAMATNQSISTMEEYKNLRQEVIDSLQKEVGLDSDEATAVADTYLKQSAAVKDLAESYSVLQDASKVSGIDEQTLADFYNSLSDEEKQVFVSLNFDSANSISDLEEQLGTLQARADKNSIEVQLTTVQNAQSDLKQNMSAEELQQFKTSSGIDWGNEEQGIIQYSEFLSMSFAQQSAYLEQLENKLQENLTQSTLSVIANDKALIDSLNTDLENANNKLIEVLESDQAKAAQMALTEAKNTLQALQDSETATEEEIASAQEAVNQAQKNYDDIIGPAQSEVDGLKSSIKNLNNEIENSEEELKIQMVLDTSELANNISSAESLAELKDYAGRAAEAFNTAATGTSIGDSSYDEYAQGLLNLASKYESCSEAADQYQSALKVLADATEEDKEAAKELVATMQNNLEAMIYCEEAAKQYGLEVDSLTAQANELRLASKDANGEITLSAEQAARLAVQNQRLNKGLVKLVDNWADWKKALKNTDKTSQDYADTLADLSAAVTDIVGWYDDLSLSSEFVAENMDLIEKSSQGDLTAIMQLGAAVAKYTVAQNQLDMTLAEGKMSDGTLNALQKYAELLGEGTTAADAFKMAQTGIQEGFDTIANNMERLQNGATLAEVFGGQEDLNNWITQLNAYAAATGMTAQQMQDMLSSVGVTANVQTDYQEQEVTVPTYREEITAVNYRTIKGTHTDENGHTEEGPSVTIPEYTKASVPDKPLTTTGYVEVASISMDGEGESPSVSPPTFTGRQAPAPSAKQGSSGSGKGGGGSSSSTEHNSEKHKDPTNEKERYHVIKNQLEDLTSQYDRISKAKDKAFGSARLANLNKEIDAQKKLTQANKQYLDEIESYLAQDKGTMASYGAVFDNNGTILNYDELVKQQVDAYNRAVDTFNAAYTDDEGAKAAFEAAQDVYDKFQDALSQYEETQDLFNEQTQTYIDSLNAERELLLERTQLQVELKVNVEEDALNFLQYALDNIENKAYDCAEAFGYLNDMTAAYLGTAKAYEEGLRSLFANQGLSDADFDNFVNGNSATFNTISQMLSDGESAGFQSEDVETIRDYVKELISANENLQEVRQTVHDQILTVWDEWNEKLDDGISKLEHLQAIQESYVNIIDIVGQKNLGVSNAFMRNLSQQGIDQANDKLVAEKARYDALKKARDDAYATFEEQKNKGILSEEEIKMWEDSLHQMDEDVRSASEDFQSAWEDALTSINEAFETEVDRIIEAYDDAAAGLMSSMSQLQEAFDRKSDLADQYLDDYEKIYQFSKLNRDIENSIDSTSNVKAKKELLELQSKINAYEEAGTEISEYQMQQLQQEYELKKAQIELEEASDAKSQVKMQRDSEGNYSYVYTANSDDVAKAEQNYEDKLHAMQQSNAEYINDLQSNMIQMEQDYQDKVKEIMTDTSLTAEERMAQLNELNDYYDEKMKFYISEAQLWEQNSQTLYEKDWMNYATMTGYKISEEDKWLDHWNETQLALLTGFETLEGYQTNHNMNVANLLLASGEAFSTWQTNIEEAMNNAGTSLGTFEKDATDAMQTVAEESEKTKDQIVDDSGDMVDAVKNVVTAVTNWETQYSKIVQDMLSRNKALVQSFNSLIAAWSKFEAAENAHNSSNGNDNSSDSGSGSGAGSGDGSGSSGSGSGSGSGADNSDKIEGVAAAIWMDGSAAGWGNGSTRRQRLQEKGVSGAQDYINAHASNGDIYSAWASKRGQLRQFYYGSFDTGGYTGEWGLDGKLALLHEKELVLNADDTTNFLKAIDVVRQISDMIDLNALSSAGGLSSLFAATASSSSQNLQQEVHITAEFPNATDKDQISEAFSDLVNLASQYANRK